MTSALFTDAERRRLYAPPAAWFATRPVAGDFRIIPSGQPDAGRCEGYVARWGQAHTGAQGQHVEPPRSKLSTPYAVFHGETPGVPGGPSVVCADGTTVNVGRVLVGGGHPDLGLSARDAAMAYADTSRVGAFVRAFETPEGLAVVGCVNPTADDATVFSLRTSDLSGDWRPNSATCSLELLTVLAVGAGGFPAGLAAAATIAESDGHRFALAASGTLVGGTRRRQRPSTEVAHGVFGTPARRAASRRVHPSTAELDEAFAQARRDRRAAEDRELAMALGELSRPAPALTRRQRVAALVSDLRRPVPGVETD